MEEGGRENRTELVDLCNNLSLLWNRNRKLSFLRRTNEASLRLSAASPRTTTSCSRTSLACGSKASSTTKTRTARSSPTLHTLASKPPHTDTNTHTLTHTLPHFTLHSPVEGMDEGMFGRRWCSSSLASAIRHAAAAIFRRRLLHLSPLFLF